MNYRTYFALGGAVALTFGVLSTAGFAQQAAPNGQALFEGRCASCHEGGVDRAPDRAALGRMTSAHVVEALNGVMAPMTEGMTSADKQAIAAYLTAPAQTAQAAGGRARRAPVQTVDTPCASNPPITPTSSDWIGAGGDQTGTRFQANPGIRPGDVKRLKVKWSFSLTQGNGQPTVIGDWLWIAGSGHIYALDTKTGCVRWRTDNMTSRTTPMPIKASFSPSGWVLIVGQRNRVVKALDAATGKELWASEELENHRASGITGSPIVAGNQVFVPLSSGEEAAGAAPNYPCCSFRGSLVALDLATGKKQWQVFPITEPMKPIRVTGSGVTLQGPAGAAIWSQPTVDMKRGLVYVATGDSYTEAASTGPDAIFAYDMATGKVRWSTQVMEHDNFVMNCTRPEGAPDSCPTPLGPDYDFGASPILFTAPNGKQVLVAGQKAALVHGFDPDTGEHLWARRVGGGGALGGVEWGIAIDSRHVYAGSSDIVSIFDELMRAQGKPTMANVPEPSDPGLSAIDPLTGRLIWKTDTPARPCNIVSARVPEGKCAAGNSGAPVAMPGVVFAGSTDGWFRAYNAANGRILWEDNTAGRTYSTVNGVPNQPGGGVDGNGPTIAQGTVFVTSGFDGASGYGSTGFGSNVLLAYTVDGK